MPDFLLVFFQGKAAKWIVSEITLQQAWRNKIEKRNLLLN